MTEGRGNDVLLPVSSALAGMGFSSSWAFTSLYMHTGLGMSYFLAGVVFTVSGIGAAFSQIYSGKAGDRAGHTGVLLTLISISTAGYAALFYVAVRHDMPLLFSALFVMNISVNSALMSPLNSLVSLSSKSPLKGFSYLRMGNNVGWGFGPFVGGYISTAFGYPFIYLLGIAMNIGNLAVVLSVRNVRGHTSESKATGRSRINPLYLYLGLTALLLFMIQGQESVTLPNFAGSFRGLTDFDIGIIFFVNGLFVMLLQVPVANITSKIGLSRGYIIGIALYAIGFFTMAFDFSLLEFVISMIIATIGENFAFPAGNAIVSTLSKNENIGSHMGLYNGFLSVGRSMGPVVGGAAMTLFTSSVKIWGIATVSGLVAIIIYLLKLSRTVNREEGNYGGNPIGADE